MSAHSCLWPPKRCRAAAPPEVLSHTPGSATAESMSSGSMDLCEALARVLVSHRQNGRACISQAEQRVKARLRRALPPSSREKVACTREVCGKSERLSSTIREKDVSRVLGRQHGRRSPRRRAACRPRPRPSAPAWRAGAHLVEMTWAHRNNGVHHPRHGGRRRGAGARHARGMARNRAYRRDQRGE